MDSKVKTNFSYHVNILLPKGGILLNFMHQDCGTYWMTYYRCDTSIINRLDNVNQIIFHDSFCFIILFNPVPQIYLWLFRRVGIKFSTDVNTARQPWWKSSTEKCRNYPVKWKNVYQDNVTFKIYIIAVSHAFLLCLYLSSYSQWLCAISIIIIVIFIGFLKLVSFKV